MAVVTRRAGDTVACEGRSGEAFGNQRSTQMELGVFDESHCSVATGQRTLVVSMHVNLRTADVHGYGKFSNGVFDLLINLTSLDCSFAGSYHQVALTHFAAAFTHLQKSATAARLF